MIFFFQGRYSCFIHNCFKPFVDAAYLARKYDSNPNYFDNFYKNIIFFEHEDTDPFIDFYEARPYGGISGLKERFPHIQQHINEVITLRDARYNLNKIVLDKSWDKNVFHHILEFLEPSLPDEVSQEQKNEHRRRLDEINLEIQKRLDKMNLEIQRSQRQRELKRRRIERFINPKKPITYSFPKERDQQFNCNPVYQILHPCSGGLVVTEQFKKYLTPHHIARHNDYLKKKKGQRRIVV